MRQQLTTLALLAAALFPVGAQAQTAGVIVVGGNGLDAFGGVFSLAPNADVDMEGPGRDVGRDIAAYWVTYRWKKPARSAAACEVNLTRSDYLGLNATMPDQAAEDNKEASRLKALAETAEEPWTRMVMARNPWGRLSLLELASLRNDGREFLTMSSLYANGRFTYEIRFLCSGGTLDELRALTGAIAMRNITED
jgi:hypothetical protein